MSHDNNSTNALKQHSRTSIYITRKQYQAISYSLSHLSFPSAHQKSMEKASAASLSLDEPFGLLFLHIILNCVFTLQELCLRFLSFPPTCEQQTENTEAKPGEDLQMRREDLEMVIGRMGLYCSKEDEQLRENISLDEIAAVFEDKEPSLEEVKEAFCVFDEKHDGFIDAVELQSVLSKLGFREGLALDACQQMIAVYDDNRDGLIDFNEFVKFMESSFC